MRKNWQSAEENVQFYFDWDLFVREQQTSREDAVWKPAPLPLCPFPPPCAKSRPSAPSLLTPPTPIR